jgi:hypothetical protein
LLCFSSSSFPKFTEYSDYDSYLNDTLDEIYEDEEGFEFQNICLSKENQMKGINIYFHTKEGKPFYVYKPLELIHPQEIQEWQENTVDYYQSNSEYKYIFMKTIYWKLEKISCVLVCRNRKWFNDNIYSLQEIWKTIEAERISGYEHRAPNRKQKKEIMETTQPTSSGCLLQFNKETGKITVIKKESDKPISIPIPDLKNIDINFNVI